MKKVDTAVANALKGKMQPLLSGCRHSRELRRWLVAARMEVFVELQDAETGQASANLYAACSRCGRNVLLETEEA